MNVPSREADNRLRWDKRPGWYEVYYVKLNELRTGKAFWLRYTLTSPAAGEPFCELWGVFFDPQNPENNFVLKDRFPIDELSSEDSPFRVSVAGSELRLDSCRGSISHEDHSLAWELELESKDPPFRMFPHSIMYKTPFPKTKFTSPHQNCRLSGKLKADGKEIDVADAPGEQAHIWGTEHALCWAWAHCNTFEQEPDAVFEGLAPRIKIGPARSPHLSMFYLKYQGKDY